jgi:hypothetical protein
MVGSSAPARAVAGQEADKGADLLVHPVSQDDFFAWCKHNNDLIGVDGISEDSIWGASSLSLHASMRARTRENSSHPASEFRIVLASTLFKVNWL